MLLSSHDNTTGSLKTLNIVNNSSSFSRILNNENLISILAILLVIIVASVIYSLYLSVLRLYKRNRIIVTYFFVQEKIIPTIRAFISEDIKVKLDEVRKKGEDTQSKVDGFEKIKADLLTYISNKDWGMAEFFASTLEDSVRQQEMILWQT
jgi:hypothetical protein